MDHPWRRLRQAIDWTLRWTHLPDGTLGLTDHTTRTIWLDTRQLQAERRCTICHELVHAARGPVPADPILAAREESIVEQETARLLIGMDELLDALRWAHDLSEAAEVLWVDDATLTVRLEHLQPAERAWLAARLADQ